MAPRCRRWSIAICGPRGAAISRVRWPCTPKTSSTMQSDSPTAPVTKAGARDFYTYLIANFRTEGEKVLDDLIAGR